MRFVKIENTHLRKALISAISVRYITYFKGFFPKRVTKYELEVVCDGAIHPFWFDTKEEFDKVLEHLRGELTSNIPFKLNLDNEYCPL